MSSAKTPTTTEEKTTKPEATTKKNEERKSEERTNPRGEGSAEQKPAAAPQPARVAINVDDSQVLSGYANFCRVSSTPEELILDLGLNPNPYAQADTTVKLSQRIIMNHYTAKRLLSALSMTVQRHEQAFGVLETDVSKRVRSN